MCTLKKMNELNEKVYFRTQSKIEQGRKIQNMEIHEIMNT